MMLLQTGQDIVFLDILITICPPLVILAAIGLGVWIFVERMRR
jgi:hypothetical protein